MNIHIQILSMSTHVTIITLHTVTRGKVNDFIVVDNINIRFQDLGMANAVKDDEFACV